MVCCNRSIPLRDDERWKGAVESVIREGLDSRHQAHPALLLFIR